VDSLLTNRTGWKVSKYLIVSESLYQTKDGLPIRIAFSTRNGSVIVLDQQIADKMELLETPSVDDQLFHKLVDSQMLVPQDENEFDSLIERNRTASADMSSREFIIFPSMSCNMGCEYCGQEHRVADPSPHHRSIIVDRVLATIRAAETQAVSIRWFGGEPMTGYAAILDMGSKIFDAVQSEGIGYSTSMTTNGSLLSEDRVRKLHFETGLTHFHISVDGPKKMHEKRRPLKSGFGSFDRILSTIGKVLEAPDLRNVIFQVRTNIDSDNDNCYSEFLAEAKLYGLANPRVFLEPARVRTWSPNRDMSSKFVVFDQFAEEEIAWLKEASEMGFFFRALPRSGKPVVCEAGTLASEVITIEGDVYSCVAKPLIPIIEDEDRLGRLVNIENIAPRPLGQYDNWIDSVASGEVPCKKCSIFGLCGGGCPKEWLEGQIPCPSYRNRANMQWRIDEIARRNGMTKFGPGLLSAQGQTSAQK